MKELVGHGIGEEFHSTPYVHHYDEPRDRTRLRPGMVFTIEPMLTLGAPDVVQWEDGWTITTLDGRPSAQFEHTVLVTSDGVDSLDRLTFTLGRSCSTSSCNGPFVAKPLPPSILGSPAKSVNVPPASPMITGIPAMSHGAATGSTIASTRPVATSA